MVTAAIGGNRRRSALGPPPIDTRPGWNRRGTNKHILSGEHPRRSHEATDLVSGYGAKLAAATPLPTNLLICRSGHIVQDRPLRSARWTDNIPQLPAWDAPYPAAWQHAQHLGADPATVCFQVGHTPSWHGWCERNALSLPVVVKALSYRTQLSEQLVALCLSHERQVAQMFNRCNYANAKLLSYGPRACELRNRIWGIGHCALY